MGHDTASADTPDAAYAAARPLRAAIDAHLASRDRAATVIAALHAVDSGALGVADLYTLVLAPLLADTGSAWQRGATRVWEEHHASATVRTVIEALAPRVIALSAETPTRDTTVLLACPPGEYHDLGLRMLLDRFLLAGYTAHFLGADTPVCEICHAAETLEADLVVLSASTHYHRVSLRQVVEDLARDLPDSTRIAVGGPAFARDTGWTAAGVAALLDPAACGLPGLPVREETP